MSEMIGTAETLPQLFQNTVAKFGAKTALRYRVAKDWQETSFAELAQRVEAVASGLAALGVKKGDRVALLSENRPEWTMVDLAVLHLGAVVVPIYPTLPSQQVAYIVRNCGAELIVTDDAKQLAKVTAARAELPELRNVVVFETGKIPEGADAISLDAVIALGAENPLGAAFYESWRGVKPDDLASLVYTSGTTGDPKGAMLTHKNFAVNVFMSLEHFARQGEAITEADTFLSFLPLSHVFERTTGYYLVFAVGGTIAYSEGVRTLLEDMKFNKPTIMVCVPRVYESFAERIQGAVEKEPETKQKVFHEAIAAGQDYAEKKRTTGHAGPVAWAKNVAFDKLVYSTIREKFGGAIRFFVAGGAALGPDTARFFEAFGLPIIEGYGMTEASPVMVINPNRRVKIGTVGICVPHGEVKIAADGRSYSGARTSCAATGRTTPRRRR
jgi:long-chain acyl-CoA synthetase